MGEVNEDINDEEMSVNDMNEVPCQETGSITRWEGHVRYWDTICIPIWKRLNIFI